MSVYQWGCACVRVCAHASISEGCSCVRACAHMSVYQFFVLSIRLHIKTCCTYMEDYKIQR